MLLGANPRVRPSAMRNAKLVVLAAPALASTSRVAASLVWMAVCSYVGRIVLAVN